MTRWLWMDILAWLAVVGVALVTYAQRVPWARIQVTLTQPGQGASSTSWSPVRAFDGAYSLLGLTLWSDGILFLWEIAFPSGFVLGWRWRSGAGRCSRRTPIWSGRLSLLVVSRRSSTRSSAVYPGSCARSTAPISLGARARQLSVSGWR